MANRAITLDGANKIFSVVGASFTQNETLGFYQCSYQGRTIQAKTLTECCQTLARTLQGGAQ